MRRFTTFCLAFVGRNRSFLPSDSSRGILICARSVGSADVFDEGCRLLLCMDGMGSSVACWEESSEVRAALSLKLKEGIEDSTHVSIVDVSGWVL